MHMSDEMTGELSYYFQEPSTASCFKLKKIEDDDEFLIIFLLMGIDRRPALINVGSSK